jgi:hypothetical protein
VGGNDPLPTIIRSPRITATLDRADFGDDPLNGDFAPNNTPLSKTGHIDGKGWASCDYYYTVRSKNDDGTWDYDTVYGTARGDFTPINDIREYAFDVYNGIKNLPKKPEISVNDPNGSRSMRTFPSGDREYRYKLEWEGTHYPLGLGSGAQVIRWMCHRQAGGSEYGWEPVDGQYGRVFIGQSTASVSWKTLTTMEAGYREDRANASERKSGSGYYANAVFATDKSLQKYAYPVKSGYYFNPIGAYSCTLTTVQYKDVDAPTEEHKELVEKIKEAFWYDSELIYVDRSGKYSTLGPITHKGGRKHGLLSIATEAGAPLYTKLKTSTAMADAYKDGAGITAIDPLIREILEGYSESGTEGSYEGYRYREQTDKELYRVEETTGITFTLGVPASGGRFYTYVNMKNGEYKVTAKVSGIEFDFAPYLEGTYSGGSTVLKMKDFVLDGIKVTVSGSMYDDRN